MPNEQRDLANQVYTPATASRTVSVPETAPTIAADGIDCIGFNVLAVTRTRVLATSVDWTLYFYDTISWSPVLTSAELVTASLYDPTSLNYFQHFNINGVSRYKFVVTATDNTVLITTNIAV